MTKGASPAAGDDIAAAIEFISGWLGEQMAENPALVAVEHITDGARQWHVRLEGEEKSVFTVRFRVHQRTLHIETQLMPYPEESSGELFEYLLAKNNAGAPLAFALHPEDGVVLVGRARLEDVDDDTLDTVLGSAYELTERCFRPAMRIGFASRFKG